MTFTQLVELTMATTTTMASISATMGSLNEATTENATSIASQQAATMENATSIAILVEISKENVVSLLTLGNQLENINMTVGTSII